MQPTHCTKCIFSFLPADSNPADNNEYRCIKASFIEKLPESLLGEVELPSKDRGTIFHIIEINPKVIAYCIFLNAKITSIM